jgi:hypothetical protein
VADWRVQTREFEKYIDAELARELVRAARVLRWFVSTREFQAELKAQVRPYLKEWREHFDGVISRIPTGPPSVPSQAPEWAAKREPKGASTTAPSGDNPSAPQTPASPRPSSSGDVPGRRKAGVRPRGRPRGKPLSAKDRSELRLRRHALIDPIWEAREYNNCEDWAAETKPKHTERVSGRALDDWLSARTEKSALKTRRWISKSADLSILKLP